MHKTPILSVIIPFYNEVKFLKESIQSVLNQEFKDFELLILDDGSTNSPKKLIDEFNDSRIRYIKNNNVGLANNINRSLHLLKGKFIARLDQDDLSDKTRFNRQLEIFSNDPSIDCVFTYIKRFGSKNSWNPKAKTQEHISHKFEPFKDGCLVNSTMMIKKEVLIELNGYRQEYYPSDDWDLELRMSQKYNVVVLHEELVSYRFHEAANTYRTFQLMQDTRRWAEDNYFRRNNGDTENSFKKHLQNKNFTTKIRHLRKDKSKLHIRIAGDNYLSKKYLSFLFHLFIAFIILPCTLINRLRNLKNK